MLATNPYGYGSIKSIILDRPSKMSNGHMRMVLCKGSGFTALIPGVAKTFNPDV